MKTYKIPYHKTGCFSKLVTDYLKQDEKVMPFYNHFPNNEGFQKQIEEKKDFSIKNREQLVKVLEEQYKDIAPSKKTKKNILSLKDKHTFTVTTGHQLNLFTGPLYFLYKIVTTIKLAEKLQKDFPNYQFVPVYWMATEDHDFDEINHFYHKGKKFPWNKNTAGGVGDISTQGLEEVFNSFQNELENSSFAKELKGLFSEAYLSNSSLAEATRFLVNKLFGDRGLVILDANHHLLKQSFKQTIKGELLHQNTYHKVLETSKNLEKDYFSQVNPRFINLFYLKKNFRERIVLEDGLYKIYNSEMTFTEEQILQELENYPERFSPNVLMRPLYQETILPNLCYIGGGGELAYWLQLKPCFREEKIPFPVLLLRNSALLITDKQWQKLNKLGVAIEDLFLPRHLLEQKMTEQLSQITIDFSPQKKHLKQQFLNLREIAKQTDASFIGAVNAQEKKQLKGLENLEKRLLKAEKRKFKDQLSRVTSLQNQLFPHQTLQERKANFSDFYLEIGEELLTLLFEHLEPLKQQFVVLKME